MSILSILSTVYLKISNLLFGDKIGGQVRTWLAVFAGGMLVKAGFDPSVANDAAELVGQFVDIIWANKEILLALLGSSGGSLVNKVRKS